MRWFLALALLVGGIAAYLALSSKGEQVAPVLRTAKVRRGTLIESVSTTGTVQPLRKVTVGTQVSGVLLEVLADWNDRVRKGQVLARLDPAVLMARVAQDEASHLAAQAAVERAHVTVDEAKSKRDRLAALLEQRLSRIEELEAAGFAVRAAEATLKAEETRVVQSAAQVAMARTNLEYATITCPIDGVVLDRQVDVGQTVAASLQAPVLFTLAEDLRRMRVEASVDESDIGRIHSGQRVTFTVDAYPERRLVGQVVQRRLSPTVTSNVVTYQVIIETDNTDELLLPGMTATVAIEVARAEDALLVPASAARFRPPEAAAAPGGEGKRGGEGAPTSGAARPGGAEGRPGGARPARATEVWVLRDGVPTSLPARYGPSDGAEVAVEAEGLAEGDQVPFGVDSGGGAPGAAGAPVNPMRLLRGGR